MESFYNDTDIVICYDRLESKTIEVMDKFNNWAENMADLTGCTVTELFKGSKCTLAVQCLDSNDELFIADLTGVMSVIDTFGLHNESRLLSTLRTLGNKGIVFTIGSSKLINKTLDICRLNSDACVFNIP